MKKSKKILAFGLAGTLLAAPGAQALTYPTFSDVSSNHWAKPAITEMAIRKVMEGVGGNSFAPEQQITYAEWAKMICITFYSHKMVKGSGSEWYSDYIATVDSLGLFKGTTSYDSSNPLVPATRYDTAHIVDRVLADKKVYWHQDFQQKQSKYKLADLGWGEFDINNYASVISDWSSIPSEHKEAVAYCYWAGILNGTGDGSFAGDMSLDRAQAAQILNKLIEVCDDNAGTSTQGANLIKQKIYKGEDRRDYMAATPVKHITRLTQLSSTDGVREDGEGGFVVDPDKLLNGWPCFSFFMDGYETASFTVTAGGTEVRILDSTNHEEIVPAGTQKQYTFTVGGCVGIQLASGGAITVSDVVLS